MTRNKNLIFLPTLPAEIPISYLLGFCAFWIGIAGLELGQDVLSAVINDTPLRWAESLSYKLFWLFFIPLSLVQGYGLSLGRTRLLGSGYAAASVALVLGLTALHLFVFSVVLFGISNLIHESPWTLVSLLYEKLSTRLYIALATYAGLSAAYPWMQGRASEKQDDPRPAHRSITVKNGKSSVVLEVADILWIGSDGAYLDIHTTGRKHVILDSLKHIITTLPENFRRIHRSTIVNIDYVRELRSRGNGDYDVIMEDQQVLRLSRNYAQPLKGLLL